MNRNSLITILGIGLLAIVGYMIWSSNPSYQNPSVTPQPSPTSGAQQGAPIVKTDSSTAPYISTVVVKGTVNPNGAPTTYWYEYGTTTGLGTQTSAYLVGSGYSTIYTPAYITGLQSNTNYYFKLNAKNAFGTVNGATYSFMTTTTPAPTGNAPTTTSTAATDVTRTTANLNGRVNPNGAEATYWLEYGTSSDLGSVTAFQSAGSGSSASAVSVSVSNLQPLTKYFFRLNAQNQFGTINGAILNFTTMGPSAATAPSVNTKEATSITDSSARLNANVNPNGSMTSYWFEYSSDSLLSVVLVSSTPEQSLNDGNTTMSVLANISNLNNNTKYYYRAVAKNQYGIIRGDTMSFTTRN